VTNRSGRPVIYLIGTSGFPNFGDEFITSAWLRHLAQTMPSAEVWVDSPRPGQSAVLHGDSHPNVRFVDSLYHAVLNAPSESADDTLAFGREVVGNPGLVPREASGIEFLEHVDVVHVIGGGYLASTWPRNLTLLAAAAAMAERYGTRTALTGAGLVPADPEAVPALTKLLAGFDVLDVRDQASHALVSAEAPHATFTGDDAFLHPELTEQDKRFPVQTLVNVQGDFLTHPLDEVADYIVRTLKEWRVDQSRVVVVESLPPDDSGIAGLLRERLQLVEVLPFSIMWRHGFPTPPRSRWVTTRFHPQLIGAANGGWGVVLPVGGDHSMVDPTTLIDAGSGWVAPPDLETVVPWQRHIGDPFDGALPKLQADKRAVAERVRALSKG
jgi:polysaccharide pyruvyl transferase WcaK-like protein